MEGTKKEKKAGRILLLTAFLVIICSSGIIWTFTKQYMDTKNYEYRKLAEKPELSLESYAGFSNQYTAYFNDHLPFRNELITLNSAIDYYGFDRSSSTHVALGGDRFLFFTYKKNGDPIGCYQGTNLYSEETLKELADNCVRQRDFIESQGREFVILIIPNKERVYSEYMPARYGAPAEQYRALQVYSYLKENTDVRVLYIYDEIMEAKKKTDLPLWYRNDTHWNKIGAYIGSRALLKELGIEIPDITEEGMEITPGKIHTGDLSRSLHLTRQLDSYDPTYTVTGYDEHNMVRTVNEQTNEPVCNATNADPRRLYVIRDSFGPAMVPYIGSQFSETDIIRYNDYTYDNLARLDPDIVVLETIERRVDKLLKFSLLDGF